MRLVTLLTDFGMQDYYVGAMKGVIASLAPGVPILDLSHEVPPGDVRAGAFLLAHATETFPSGTVHCAVVDPGVGTERRAIVCAHNGQLFVAPDNGLVSWAVGPEAQAWVIERLRPPEGAPATFHGRDLFAPVAARLAAGMAPEGVGRPVTDVVRLEWPEPVRRGPSEFQGEVVFVDRFGNLVSNVPAEWVGTGQGWRVEIGGQTAPLARTFGDVAPGQLVSYPGSAGLIEVAVRDGSAAARLGLGRGAGLRVVRRT